MRMTNKIMRNNSLYNINQNKLLEDKLSNQMTNQSKITRPSDDPVVAIRALRLRTNVTTVTQYYEKNSEDANQWISLTGESLNVVDDVLTNLLKQATDSSKKSYTYADLQVVLTQIQSMTKEFYASGNVDYSGRYIFAGYRTDTPVTFTAEDIKEFTKDPDNLKTFMIEENLGYQDISRIGYTDWADATDLKNNATDERDVTNTTLYRFRLAYNDLTTTTETVLDANGDPVLDADGNEVTTLTQPSQDFHLYINNIEVQTTQFDDAEEAYQAVKNGYRTDSNGNIIYLQNPDGTPVLDNEGNPVPEPVEVAYIPSTGEIVFGEDFYINQDKDWAKVSENMQVRVKYSKSSWEEGDINPVHYFHCIASDERSKQDAMKLEGAENNLSDVQSVIKNLDKVLEKLDAADINSAQKAVDAALKTLNDLKDKDAEGIDSDVLDTAINAVSAVQNAVQAASGSGVLTGLWTLTRTAIDAVEDVEEEAQIEVNRIRNLVTEYNPEKIDQDIYYDVGFNQQIQVNVHASEVFTHGVQRDYDDFQIYLKQLQDVEDKIKDIEGKMKEYEEDSQEYKDLELKLDAANKAYTYIRDNVQTKFENQISKYQKYLDDANVAITNNGTRGQRLDLIKCRLMEQQSTFKDLQSANEDVDTTEVAVKLKSAELTYEAALMATSKIMQTNLMNYI